MEVTRSVITRLQVKLKCGCSYKGEFNDIKFEESAGDPIFEACETHLTGEGNALVREMLLQVLDKEIAETRKYYKEKVAGKVASPPPATVVPAAAPTAPAPPAASEPAGRPLPKASEGPRRPTGSHRPTGGSSSGGGMIRRVNPTANMSAHAAAALTSKTAGSSIDAMLIDFEGGGASDAVVSALDEALGVEDDIDI